MHEGRMSAVVSPEGTGFVVDTPSVHLVDHGTEFGVDVREGTSEVHVFEGKVSVLPKEAPPETETVQLVSNQATRVSGVSGIPEGIDIDHERFIRHLNEGEPGRQQYRNAIVSLDPSTYLRMSPAKDGTTLQCKGTSKSDGRLVMNQMASPAFRPGRVGSSLYLDGPASGAYAMIREYQPARDGKMTLCAWVRAESRPRWAAIAKHWSLEFSIDRSTYSGLGGQFHFGLHKDSGDLELQVRDGNGTIVKMREGEPFPLETWQHVAFVVDGQKVSMYRNGKLIDSADCVGLATDGPSGIGIGAKLNSDCSAPSDRNPGFWHGRIDELAIFHDALSDEQIMSLFELARGDDVG